MFVCFFKCRYRRIGEIFDEDLYVDEAFIVLIYEGLNCVYETFAFVM